MQYGSRESQALTRLVLVLIAFVFARVHVCAQSDLARAKAYVPRLEKILNENIASFWLSKSLDQRDGGYIINFGPEGEPKGAGTKMIVSQARQVWLFSRMARGAYGDRRKNLAAADLGYRFLKEKMWDAKNGGFYWEVNAIGDKKLRPKKHLYGQAFALYALSEYYLASRRQDVLDFARHLFDLLEAKSHDKEFGGYLEYFNEDWTTPPPGEASYMGVTPDFKLMNTHLHLLEALTTFYRASKSPLARERLIELINIESNSVVRKNLGACTDKYARNWEPQLDGGYARVSYGHDLENIWLLIDACDAAGVSHYPFLDLYKSLFDYSMRHGYDAARGGFYDVGAFNRPADRRDKVWWVQAEAIVSALYMYRLTRNAKYLSVFEKTFDFIEKNHVDWKRGEWHAVVTPEGKVEGDKAHAWKAGYHGGRAMIECVEILKRMQ